MSAPQIGILMSLIQVMRIFGPNLWGWVADHTQQRVKVLRLTAVAALVAFAGIFFGRSFAQLFAGDGPAQPVHQRARRRCRKR